MISLAELLGKREVRRGLWESESTERAVKVTEGKANEAYPVADPELTALGHQQATETGKLLQQHLPPSLIPSKLFVTPLIRGIQSSADMWQQIVSGDKNDQNFDAIVIEVSPLSAADEQIQAELC